MAQSMMKLLECQICTEIFNEADRKPKVLPCQHTICLHCMKQLVRNTFRETTYNMCQVVIVIKCPTCNAEYDVPENDVGQYPNNITMISFLSVAPGEESPISGSRSRSPRNHKDDIKQCLEDRVQKLRDKVAEAQVDYIKRFSSWDQQVGDMKKMISTHCEQFKQAVDRREAALVKQIDEFSAKRQASYEKANAEFNWRLLEITNFCDRVEENLKAASERETTQNLDKCLEMTETLDDQNDQESTNGTKWTAMFNPDRKDTVDASIKMFGQLVLQEPVKAGNKTAKTTKKKVGVHGDRSRKVKRVYTRDFLLQMQPSCFHTRPRMGYFPEIHSVMPDVTSSLQMNDDMLKKRPFTMHLFNISTRKYQTVHFETSTSGAEAEASDDDIFPYDHKDIVFDDIDWTPPRLVLGNVQPLSDLYD